MGLTYSTEETNTSGSTSKANINKANDITNKLDKILASNGTESDTLAGITELQQRGGGCGDNDNKAIEKQIRQKLSQSGNKYSKYDIKNIMGKISNDILNAGNNQSGQFGGEGEDEKNKDIVSDLPSLNLNETTDAHTTNVSKKVQSNDQNVDSEKSENTENTDNSDNSDNSDNKVSATSEMGTSTNTNERLEKKIIKSIFNAQHGGAASYDDSESSTTSSDFKTRKFKNKHPGFDKKHKENKDPVDRMASKLEKLEKDIKSDKADKEPRKQKEHKKKYEDSEMSEDIEFSDNSDNSEESEESERVETSNGSDEQGISIFPFDSESNNSYKNFRMLKRSF